DPLSPPRHPRAPVSGRHHKLEVPVGPLRERRRMGLHPLLQGAGGDPRRPQRVVLLRQLLSRVDPLAGRTTLQLDLQPSRGNISLSSAGRNPAAPAHRHPVFLVVDRFRLWPRAFYLSRQLRFPDARCRLAIVTAAARRQAATGLGPRRSGAPACHRVARPRPAPAGPGRRRTGGAGFEAGL
ncbi:hypothetical protein HK405_012683, partial [Cladochytrium tenue]